MRRIARRPRLRQRPRPSQRAAGFTVIELLVALSVLALMMLLTWGSTRQTIQAKEHFEQVQGRYREVRVAMNRIVRDLSMAYISGNEDRNLMEPRTMFIGEASGSGDSLRFSTFAHTPLYADANESDQTIVGYWVASDPQDRSREALLRRENRRLGNERWDSLPGETSVLLTGVTRFKLTYWDVQGREWKDSWSSQITDGATPKVPDRVRITVGFLDERGKEVTLTTEARIHVQEMLQFYAN